MGKLFQSRKFLLILVDAVFLLAGAAVAFFIDDTEWQKFIVLVLGIVQPVFITAIAAIAVEDKAALNAGVHPRQIGK